MSKRGRLDYGTSEGVKSAVTLKLPRWNGKSSEIPRARVEERQMSRPFYRLLREASWRRRRSAACRLLDVIIDRRTRSRFSINIERIKEEVLNFLFISSDARQSIRRKCNCLWCICSMSCVARELCNVDDVVCVLVGHAIGEFIGRIQRRATHPFRCRRKANGVQRRDTPAHSCLWKLVHLPGSPMETIRHKL